MLFILIILTSILYGVLEYIMLSAIPNIEDRINEYLDKNGSPYTRNWWPVRNPMFTLYMVIGYLTFVYFGPIFMRNQKAFVLRKPMIIYNGLQAVISAFLFITGTLYGFTRYNWLCEPLQKEIHPDDYVIMWLAFAFYCIRFFEFIDTVFFILRKKNSHITKLHVIHHSLMPFFFWCGLALGPYGHNTFAPYLNAFVHTIMYTYYMLAAMGPEYEKYIWWKKYVTKLQLAQFLLIIAHSIYTIVSDCPVNKDFSYLLLVQAILFFSLFSNFYTKAFVANTANMDDSQNKWTNLNSKYLSFFNLPMVKKFGEMCIPDQTTLYEDNIEEDKATPSTSASVEKTEVHQRPVHTHSE